MRTSYRVNLKAMAALCEANFLRLQRVLKVAFPVSEDGDRQAQRTAGDAASIEMPDYGAALFLEFCDIAPFTTSIKLEIRPKGLTKHTKRLDFSDDGDALFGILRPFQVRVYHDLRMAEVIDFAERGVGKSRYDYPNAKMLASDERWQQNQLLGEWLSQALQHGVPNRTGLEKFCPELAAGQG